MLNILLYYQKSTKIYQYSLINKTEIPFRHVLCNDLLNDLSGHNIIYWIVFIKPALYFI